MASLIEEELARRDSAASAPSQPTSRTYMRPADRLRSEALDVRRARDVESAAQREAMMAQKADIAGQRAGIAERALENRIGVDSARLDLAGQAALIDQKKADLAAAELMRKNDQTLKILDQATGFLKDARGMDPTKPEFDKQFQDLVAGYPMAAEHPSVQKWLGYHQPLREKFVAEEIALRKPVKEGTQVKAPFGTEQVSIKNEDGSITKTTVPLPDPNSPAATAKERARLESEHAALDAKLQKDANFITGKPKADDIAKLNEVKAKLGYQLLDSAGQVTVPVPTPPVVPATSPVVPASAPAQLKALDDNVAAAARAAIAAGKDAKAVAERLRASGYDPSGL